MGTLSKNNPANKTETKKIKLALSNDCEECKVKCPKGLQYLIQMKNSNVGRGVVCNK